MTHVCSRSAVLVMALAIPSMAAAQSLGDVAKQEEARRKKVAAPGKVYTNDVLKGGDVAPSPPQTESSASGSTTPESQAGEKAPEQTDDKRKDEKYWRGRMESARNGLERAKTVQEALQSRINALSADFVARDDPAQRRVIATDREKALAELERMRKEISDLQKQMRDLEDEARKAGAPPGWLR